jgi:hypothetical protein
VLCLRQDKPRNALHVVPPDAQKRRAGELGVGRLERNEREKINWGCSSCRYLVQFS